MAERQKHGLDFENWVRETFTTNAKAPKTAKWDIASPNYRGEYKDQLAIFANRPVSIKTCQGRSAIYFADALRQYENTQEFLLIVGFYTTAGNAKVFHEISVSIISPIKWHDLFAEITLSDEQEHLTAEQMGPLIVKFKGLVSDKNPHYNDLRKMAKAEKKNLPRTEMRLNQKIGSDNKQRRLQCSLPYSTFWSKFGFKGQVYADGKARLWGVEVPKF
ncbi:MAG: hypothetical protein WA584_03240 [Pyrinomonadaceae bacterium]